MKQELFQYLLSVIGIIVGVLFFCLLVARRRLSLKKIDWYNVFLYASVTFLFAVIFEIISDTLYLHIFGKYLWQYKVFPVHNGITTQLALFFWPLYGVYLYFLHRAFKVSMWNGLPIYIKGGLSGIDGPLLEFVLNSIFLVFYKTFFFYYVPNDLGHYTTLQVVPIYAICGMVLTYILYQLEKFKRNFLLPAVLYFLAVGIVYL